MNTLDSNLNNIDELFKSCNQFVTILNLNQELIEKNILIPSGQKILCSSNSKEYNYNIISIKEIDTLSFLKTLLTNNYNNLIHTTIIIYGNSITKENIYFKIISDLGKILYNDSEIKKLNGMIFDNYNDFIANIQGNYMKKAIISIYSKEESEKLMCEFELINLQLFNENQIFDIKNKAVIINCIDESDLEKMISSLNFIELIVNDWDNIKKQNINFNSQNNIITDKSQLNNKYLLNNNNNIPNNDNNFQSVFTSKFNSINQTQNIEEQDFENRIINNQNPDIYNYDNIQARQNSIISDNKIYKEDINRLNNINRHLENALHEQRKMNYDLVSQNEQLNKNNSSLCNQYKNLKNCLDERKNQENYLMDILNCKSETEKRLNETLYVLGNLKIKKSQLEMDYQILMEDYNKLKYKNDNDIKCLNYIREEQEKNMINIEKNVASMLNEIDKLKKENSDLKKEKENINCIYEKNIIENQNIQEKYMEEKCKNDKLFNEYEKIKKLLKNYQISFNDEELWNKNNEEKKKNEAINKIKLINELHQKIQNYRTNRIKRNYSE